MPPSVKHDMLASGAALEWMSLWLILRLVGQHPCPRDSNKPTARHINLRTYEPILRTKTVVQSRARLTNSVAESITVPNDVASNSGSKASTARKTALLCDAYRT